MLKDRESKGPTARLRNRKWGARETCFEQWSLTHLQCVLWHHLVETTHWHSLFFLGAVLTLGVPTEYYPFKRCQVPVGHLVFPNIKVFYLVLYIYFLITVWYEIVSLVYTFCLFGILIFCSIYLYPSAFYTLYSIILHNVIKKTGA